MLSLNKLFALFTASAATLVAAVPTVNVVTINATDMVVGSTESKRSGVHDRASTGTVYFCVDIGFSGMCYHYVDIPDNNMCFGMPAGFDNAISSFGPDSGLGCILYTDGACAAGPGEKSSGSIFNPGVSDLRTKDFNDVASSFTCTFY